MSCSPATLDTRSPFPLLHPTSTPSDTPTSSSHTKSRKDKDRESVRYHSHKKSLTKSQRSDYAMPPLFKQITLSQYVPVGTFTLPIDPQAVNAVSDDWTEVSDGSLDDEQFLIKYKWIRCFRRRHRVDPNYSVTRVYVLPLDVASHDIYRSWREIQLRLRCLITTLDITKLAWQGEGGLWIPTLFNHMSNPNGLYTKSGGNEEALFYIFNTIESPLPDPRRFDLRHDRYIAEDILSAHYDEKYGMRTALYPYQRRSIVSMMEKEVRPRRRLDPRLQEVEDQNGKPYYFDLIENTIFREAHLYEDVRGGILAETMGYGKTFIIIGLILATRYHIPLMPADAQLESVPRGKSGARPLTLITADLARRLSLPWASFLQEKWDCDGQDFTTCRALLNRPRTYDIAPPPPARATRALQPYRTMHISSATLIVVPHNLLRQWKQEFSVHLFPETLNILEIDYSTVPLPQAKEIAKYDVVLIEQRRLQKEMDSYTSNPAAPAPLRDVHFLRLVVDEGHEFASSGTSGRWNKLRQVCAERRWVVTGTPTSGMLGAEIELAADQQSHDHADPSIPQTTDSTEQQQARTNALLERRKERVKHDEEDLVRLGRIVQGLLQVQPWCNAAQTGDNAHWSSYTSLNHRVYGGGRAATSVRSIMQSLVVRHRMADVEAELPPLDNRAVRLEPTLYDRFTVDMFVLVMSCNAITSERTDKDYLFDRRNRRSLDQLIRNLRRSSFFWLGFSKTDIQQPLRTMIDYIDKHSENLTESDHQIVKAAEILLPQIVSDGIWHRLNEVQEMGFSVTGMPQAVTARLGIDGTSLSNKTIDSLASTPFAAIPATKLIGMQTNISARIDKGQPDPLRELCQELKHLAQGSSKLSTRDMFKEASDAGVSSTTKPNRLLGVPTSGLRKDIALKSKTFEAHKALGFMKVSKTTTRRAATDGVSVQPVPAGDVRLTGSISAKLSYLLERVLDLYMVEKILIFYEGDDIAWYIAQGLEVLGVAHFIYSNGIGPAKRNEYLQAFSRKKSEERVMLIDLKQGAHGLNITAASRIFFVNPVWSAGQEAQAVKRAHRIGQSRPVFVETLILKDSIEEAMWERRLHLNPEERRSVDKNPIDDAEILRILQDFRFRVQNGEIDATSEEHRFAPIKQTPLLFLKLHRYLEETSDQGSKASKAQGDQVSKAEPKATILEAQRAVPMQSSAVMDAASAPSQSTTATSQHRQQPVSTGGGVNGASGPSTTGSHASAGQEARTDGLAQRPVKKARFA